MASIRMTIHSWGKLSFPNSTSGDKLSPNSTTMVFPSNSNFSKKFPNQGLSSLSSRASSITPSNPETVSPPNYEHPTGDNSNSVEKIDSWMRDSVGHIVKNLKQAPLLVQIYGNPSNTNGGGIRIQTEKVIMEKWPELKIKWEKEGSMAPDGLIFVDALDEEDEEDGDGGLGEGVSRAWGLVVQGKGVECGPTCYLLKTNSVVGGIGLGFCTHFCLMRVNNFRDGALDQLRDSWLLQ